MNWDFFERKIVLTCDDVLWCQAQEEFARVGLDGYEKFTGLPLDNDQILGPHQSFNASERKILTEFYESGAQTLLHLEDDCVFRDLGHLKQALSELPDAWDIVYLGANLVCWNNGERSPERYSDYLFRVFTAWTTHCVGYNRRCVLDILEKQPGFSEQMFDQYLSSRLHEFNAFVVAPMVAYQRPHVSAIWNRFDDYTPIFEASDARLR